jgi:hypothetical protein
MAGLFRMSRLEWDLVIRGWGVRRTTLETNRTNAQRFQLGLYQAS